MQIKYIGTPGEDHAEISMYGTTFPVGKYVEVSDYFAVRKLSKHPHFEHKGEVQDVVDKREEQALQLLTAVAVDEAQAQQAEEDATIAALTDEEKYGNADGIGTESASEAGDSGGERGRKPGRPRKGT